MGEETVSGIGAFLLGNGALGVMCLCLIIACVRLFSLYIQVQEQRITEARDTIRVLADNTKALETSTDVVRALMQQQTKVRR